MLRVSSYRFKEVVKWFEKAADQAAMAQDNLGGM